jgi:hypothetical protein
MNRWTASVAAVLVVLGADVASLLRACEEIAPDVVWTFRSARHGRPEGLHYSDFFLI